MPRIELCLPDLGLDDQPITLSVGSFGAGARVTAGERMAEVLAGPATVDLPSPVDGILIGRLVDEDEPLAVGQPLAVIETAVGCDQRAAVRHASVCGSSRHRWAGLMGTRLRRKVSWHDDLSCRELPRLCPADRCVSSLHTRATPSTSAAFPAAAPPPPGTR